MNLLFFASAVGIIGQIVSGQTPEFSADKKSPLPPTEEIFEQADALALPWRDSGCIGYNPVLDKPNCREITRAEWAAAHALTIYDENGAVWYHFSVDPDQAGYFAKNKKEGFLPFASYNTDELDGVFLRLIGESPNWYKVEVNEETQATKYILKTDPLWAKRGWEHLFAIMKFFKYKENGPELFEKPEGKVSEEATGIMWTHLDFYRIDGDWAYVRGIKNTKRYYGWMRWRKDRDIYARNYEAIIINQKNK